MRQLPGGVWYEPADTGFNNTPVAASAVVNGAVVPWSCLSPIRRVVFFFEIVSGASADFSLNLTPFDANGQFELHGASGVWTNISGDSSAWFADDSISRDISGTSNSNALGLVLGSPYLRFAIANNDGVNAGNVSVRAMLMR